MKKKKLKTQNIHTEMQALQSSYPNKNKFIAVINKKIT